MCSSDLLDTVWHLTRNFGLYGDVAVTALWSSFHNNTNHNVTISAETTNTPDKKRTITIMPVLEFGLGAMYTMLFNNDACQLLVKAGWEEQVWVNYNHNSINGTWNTTGNLSLQGLTLKAGLAF